MGNFSQFLTELSACETAIFLSRNNSLSKSQGIFTKLDHFDRFGLMIDTVPKFCSAIPCPLPQGQGPGLRNF